MKKSIWEIDLWITPIKVYDESVYKITLNNFLLHVPNHALKRFLIEVLIDLITEYTS